MYNPNRPPILGREFSAGSRSTDFFRFKMHQRLRINLKISSHKLMQYYEGEVDTVMAKTVDGRTIRFPANILRSVVQNDGVYGTFELVFDENHKFVSINPVSI